MDLDRFKTINDYLGHEAGDRLLVTVAEPFKQRLRPEDVIARFGGDEFAVLLETVENPSEVILVAQRIVDSIREPFTVDDHQVGVSTSVGIALGTTHANDDPEAMLRESKESSYSSINPRSPCTMGAWSTSKPCCAGNIPKEDYSNRRPSCLLLRKMDLITPIGRWVLEEARGRVILSQFSYIAGRYPGCKSSTG